MDAGNEMTMSQEGDSICTQACRAQRLYNGQTSRRKLERAAPEPVVRALGLPLAVVAVARAAAFGVSTAMSFAAGSQSSTSSWIFYSACGVCCTRSKRQYKLPG